MMALNRPYVPTVHGGPVPPPGLMKAESPWMSTVKEESRPHEDEEERVLRKVRGILNNLTEEKYEIMKTKLIDTRITTLDILQGVASLIINKAVMEPTFCPLYARLCSELADHLPSFASPQGKEIKFMRILLDECQEAFESMKAGETMQQTMTGVSDQDSDTGYKERSRNLGNIRFICELAKQRSAVLTVVRHMLKHLGEQDDVNVDVEAICLLLKTVGKQLDESSDKSCGINDLFFDRLKSMLETNLQLEVGTTLKYMLLDVMDLRANNWVDPRPNVKIDTVFQPMPSPGIAGQPRGEASSARMSIPDFLARLPPDEARSSRMRMLMSRFTPAMAPNSSLHSHLAQMPPHQGLFLQKPLDE